MPDGATVNLSTHVAEALTAIAEAAQGEPIVAKVRDDPAWMVEEWATRHNVLADGPDRVLDLLTTVFPSSVGGA